jgi:hypothetical protein
MTTELEKANAVVADLERKRQSVVDHYDKLASERAAITGSWSVRSGRMAKLMSFSAKRGSRRNCLRVVCGRIRGRRKDQVFLLRQSTFGVRRGPANRRVGACQPPPAPSQR